MRFGLVLALALAGCWRGASEPVAEGPAPARVKGASCDQASANARVVLAAAEDKELAERARPFGEILLRRCDFDAWSMELRRCVTGAGNVSDLSGCERLATDNQRKKLEHDLEVFEVAEDKQ